MKKSFRPKRTAPYKKRISKATVAATKAIVRKELHRDEETKFFSYATEKEIAGGVNGIVSYNLFYQGIQQGLSDNAMIGEKLKWKGICIKYKMYNANFTTGFNWNIQPVIWDFYILRIPVYKTITNLTASDLFNPTTNDANVAFMNKQVKVLFKKTVRITPQQQTATQRIVRNGKIWLSRNQVVQFNNLASGYEIKGPGQYYLVMINRSISTETSYCYFAWQNYFTDA